MEELKIHVVLILDLLKAGPLTFEQMIRKAESMRPLSRYYPPSSKDELRISLAILDLNSFIDEIPGKPKIYKINQRGFDYLKSSRVTASILKVYRNVGVLEDSGGIVVSDEKPEMKFSLKIFFSYSRVDSEFALGLGDKLRSAGCNIWLDQMDIAPGRSWDDEIEKALRECQTVLVILSPNSVASQNVKDEISYALKKSKRILTIMYLECEVPFRIDRVQRIDFTKSYDEGFNRLSRALAQAKENET